MASSIKMTVHTVYKLNVTEGNSPKDASISKSYKQNAYTHIRVFKVKQGDFTAQTKPPFNGD